VFLIFNKVNNIMKTHKHKTKKALMKRVKVTGSGKIMISHQLRSGHLRRNKSKSALRRHAVPKALDKTLVKAAKRMLGI
jgi:ribosomal protein L35